VVLFRRLAALGLRRFAALYLLLFFGAVAIAPHQHANSIEDLIFDGPSDSGIFLEESGSQSPAADRRWSSARWRDDDPCLACFHHDFDSATEGVEVFTLAPGLGAPPQMWVPDHSTIPSIPLRSSPSRAPPTLA